MSGSVIALGMFDGMHRGHRKLISETVEYARETGRVSYVYSFSNHPLSLIDPKMAPPMLLTDGERSRAIKQSGADRIIFSQFDEFIMNTEPDDFINMLKEKYDMRCAVVGFNYTFGKNCEGNTEFLIENASRLGIEVIAIPPVMYEGEVVSSSRIRNCIINGEIEKANSLLMSEYEISAEVVKNKGLGAKIGFPTANIENVEGKTIPKDGTYETRSAILGENYKSVTNIGRNPTFNGMKQTIETHILDFCGDIYGKRLNIEFIRRLRDCVRFNSAEALKEQIWRDIGRVRNGD
ncbi:MAG: bifunctional riboflavin kinase/FAD synthetase [Clostridia bacterium]